METHNRYGTGVVSDHLVLARGRMRIVVTATRFSHGCVFSFTILNQVDAVAVQGSLMGQSAAVILHILSQLPANVSNVVMRQITTVVDAAQAIADRGYHSVR